MTRLATSPVRKSTDSLQPMILGIGTANPPSAPQELALELALELGVFDDTQKSWIKRLFLRSGIETRCSVLTTEGAEDPLAKLREFYLRAKGPDDRGPTTGQRIARYAIEAPGLAEKSARMALENAEVAADQITHLITASCTGFFAPGLDSVLIDRLNLPRTVKRIHVGFMGCHAAFNALSAARDAAAADSEARVLFCTVELCSLHQAYGIDPGKLVANSLFADGSAAAVIGQAETGVGTGFELTDFSSFLMEACHDAMTWQIGDHGFEMTLSAGVPEIIRRQLAPWCKAWLAENNLEVAEIKGWAIHPGGPKILTAVAEALSFAPDDLRFSRDILKRYGNMSSATVMYIVQKMAAEISGPVVGIGLGPGLIAEGMLLNG